MSMSEKVRLRYLIPKTSKNSNIYDNCNNSYDKIQKNNISDIEKGNSDSNYPNKT